jgi:arylsulfatase A-like enzyme
VAKRPNFILFINDQHRADHLGCYGNDIVRTPNIDGLAVRGTRFTKFHVACPICMPNRSTLMTGRMPSLHGARQNGIPLALDATTFPDLLRAAGYRTALIGKCHLQNISARPITMGLPQNDGSRDLPPEALRDARKDRWADGRYDQELPDTWTGEQGFEPALPFYGFDHLSLAIGHGDAVSGHYSRWLAARHDDPDSLRGANNALPGPSAAPQAWRTSIPEELYPTSFVAQETMDYLDRHAKSGTDDPFFIQCSFPDPHHPFTPPGKYWDMYDAADVPAPDAFHHAADKLPPHVATLHGARDDGSRITAGMTVFACTEDEARAAIAHNYGSITMIDDAIGRVLARLAALGLADDTVVIFTTDHGDFLGDHQLILKGAIHYQGLIRVPCIWSDPAESGGGGVVDSPCGTLDLAPTIVKRAGLEGFIGMQGLDLTSMGKGIAGADHDAVVIEEDQRRTYMGFPSNFRARTLVTKRHRLTIYSCVEWGELYDLEADPNEFENLWDVPAQAPLRAELVEQLARKLIDLADPSPLTIGHGP